MHSDGRASMGFPEKRYRQKKKNWSKNVLACIESKQNFMPKKSISERRARSTASQGEPPMDRHPSQTPSHGYVP